MLAQNSINLLLVIIIVGSLFMLAFLVLSNLLKVNRKANIFFGGFLFLWLTFWSDEIFNLINLTHTITVTRVLSVLQLTIPLLFYLSVRFFTNPYKQFKKYDYLHLVIPTTLFFAIILKASYWRSLFVFSLLTQALFYTVFSYYLLEKHQKNIEFFSSDRELVDLKWIKQIIISLIGICVFIFVYNILDIKGNLNIIANSITLVIVYFIAYHVMVQKEIFYVSKEDMENILKEEKSPAISKVKLISDNEVNLQKKKIETFMQTKKPYLESDISLSKLAEYVDLSPHQLSYVLNEGFHKNFFQYINEYRVEEAISLLNNEKFNHLSILGIAYESGFNSKSAFNTVFKKQTGKTPSMYKK